MTDRLLEAVDALTLETRSKVVQWFTLPDGREHSSTTTIRHDPLLDQLEAAIASTIGAGAGRAMTAKWALNVLDSDALYQFTLIDTQIRDWCRMTGVKVTPHAGSNLRAWYAHRLAAGRDEHARDDDLATILGRWAGVIRAKLDPPRSMELTVACPACGADTWTDVDGTTYRHPVRIEYWDGDPDILKRARALCRACSEVWRGSHELRALRWEVDVRDTPMSSAGANGGHVG